jgi:hypothetical protein
VRQSLAIRGILLWLIGLALIATGVPVYVILPAYALLFLLALPLLRLGSRTLWIVAAVLAFVMPWVQPALDALPLWQGETGAILALVLGWHYPVTIWIAFVVAVSPPVDRASRIGGHKWYSWPRAAPRRPRLRRGCSRQRSRRRVECSTQC